MVDRIDKMDPKLYQIHRAGEDRRQKQGEAEDQEKKKKERDKFEKKGAGWKRLIPTAAGVRTNPLLSRTAPRGLATGAPLTQEHLEEESSLTLSERILVLWGILDRTGRPRVPVIFTYLTVLGLILIGTILIGVFVWR